MGKCTFKGGCHPYDGKEFSKDKPIKELFPAVGEMVFPLSQHIGAPAKPVVAKGDYVLAGQLIAEAGGFVSAFESERTWFWDNQDYHKMGLDTISPDNGYGRDTPITDYGYRYIYSTEYVNPTKELYNKLEKYIDKKYRNYDDFVNGRQVVVFLQDAPDGTYDDTLKAGDTLNYNYYQLPERYDIRKLRISV